MRKVHFKQLLKVIISHFAHGNQWNISFFFLSHIGTAFMFVCFFVCLFVSTSISPYYYILTYLFCVTVILLLCYFMLCAFVTYSNKLLLLLLLHKHIAQKANCCISKTREFTAGSLTRVLCLVSLTVHAVRTRVPQVQTWQGRTELF